MFYNNSTLYTEQKFDFSTFDLGPAPPTPAMITWSVLLGVIGIVALATNSLTIAAFTKKRLQRPPHYLLVSLACADFMVALVSVPIYTCIILGVAKFTLKSRAAFWFCDFLSGMASIFTLASISLERLFAMGWPLHHRTSSPLTYACFIAVPWLLALVVASLPVLDMFRLLPHLFMFHVVLASCCVAIFVTVIAYVTLWFKVRSSDSPGQERSREKDKRLAITLVIATLIFVFTWLPYPIILSIINLCLKCVYSNMKLFNDLSLICKFMHLANSFMNPLVYILRIPEFRGAIRELICCNRPFRRVGVMPLENTAARNQATQTSSLARSHSN
ncbi:melanopsin-like [Oculina patagonica]